MTRRQVTDEDYGQLSRRVEELKRRVDEGSLPHDPIMARLQSLIEGNFFFIDYFKIGIFVEYFLDLEDMIEKIDFDLIASEINSTNFPVEETGVRYGRTSVDFKLLGYGGSIEREDVVQEVGNRGCRFATLPEMLAFLREADEVLDDCTVVSLYYSLRNEAPVVTARKNKKGQKSLTLFKPSGDKPVRFLIRPDT